MKHFKLLFVIAVFPTMAGYAQESVSQEDPAFKTEWISSITPIGHSNAKESGTSRWTQITASDDLEMTAYIDKNSVRKVGNKVKLWRMSDYNIRKNTNYNFKSSVYMSEFDCKRGQTRVLIDNYYSGQMGVGKPVRQINDPKPWVRVAPNTVASIVMGIACAEK